MEDINDRDKRSSEGTHDLWREFNATERTDTTTSVALVRVPEDGAELVLGQPFVPAHLDALLDHFFTAMSSTRDDLAYRTGAKVA